MAMRGESAIWIGGGSTRARKAAPLEPEEWAHYILKAADLPSTIEPCRTLANGCRAAYTLQRFLWTKAVEGYNPKKHRGDWMDKQLLLYLAYPRAVFVSCEERLPERIVGSGQEHQVKAFDELWEASQAGN